MRTKGHVDLVPWYVCGAYVHICITDLGAEDPGLDIPRLGSSNQWFKNLYFSPALYKRANFARLYTEIIALFSYLRKSHVSMPCLPPASVAAQDFELSIYLTYTVYPWARFSLRKIHANWRTRLWRAGVQCTCPGSRGVLQTDDGWQPTFGFVRCRLVCGVL